MKLSVELEKWRIDRPDEWKMDEFVRNAAKLESERDALASQVEALRREIQSAADWFSAYWPELNKAQCDRIRQMDKIAKTTPQQHLAEIRAQAVEYAADQLANLITAPPGLHSSAVVKLNRIADSIRLGK